MEIFDYLFIVLGAFGIIFRIWLVQFKLKDELEFRKDYVSRYMSVYFFIAMALQFQNELFNLIVATALPLMLVSFIGWDTLFFYKFKKRTYWEKNHGWLIVERLTMHPPMLIVALYWWIAGLENVLLIQGSYATIIAAVILVFAPMLLFDKRMTEKYIAPTGMNIFVSAILCLVGMVIYLEIMNLI